MYFLSQLFNPHGWWVRAGLAKYNGLLIAGALAAGVCIVRLIKRSTTK